MTNQHPFVLCGYQVGVRGLSPSPFYSPSGLVWWVGAPDSDIFIGWFNSTNREDPPVQAGQFLGVHGGGPTRVAHYFQPAYATAKATKGQAKAGPVLEPGKAYDWSLVYDPAAEGGQGSIRVTLGDESVALVLTKGIKTQGACFDRFGLFTSTIGGQVVQIFVDDLKYTAAQPAP